MSRPDWERFGLVPIEPEQRRPYIAWKRAEDEPCERGTVGCSVHHPADGIEGSCEPW